MILSCLVLLGLLAWAAGLILVDPHRRRPALLPPAEPEFLGTQVCGQVTVHTTNGDTIRGVLTENLPIGVILDAAEYLDSETAVPLAGRIFVSSSKINFIQGSTT